MSLLIWQVVGTRSTDQFNSAKSLSHRTERQPESVLWNLPFTLVQELTKFNRDLPCCLSRGAVILSLALLQFLIRSQKHKILALNTPRVTNCKTYWFSEASRVNVRLVILSLTTNCSTYFQQFCAALCHKVPDEVQDSSKDAYKAQEGKLP